MTERLICKPRLVGLSILVILSVQYVHYVLVAKTLGPTLFIDEYFHARQAFHYLAGDFKTWIPEITTPPGLYILSYALVKSLNLVGFSLPLTNVEILRLQNFCINVLLLPWLFLNISGKLSNKCHTSLKLQIRAITLSLIPILAFYGSLYYTEIGSNLFILLSFNEALSQRPLTASVACFISLWFRQTNISYVPVAALFYLSKSCPGIFDLPPVTRLRGVGEIIDRVVTCFVYLRQNTSILLQLSGFAVNIILFSVFLILNKGIVLGHKEQHAITIHLAQTLYFAAFTVFMSFPLFFNGRTLRNVYKLCVGSRKSVLRFVALNAIVILIIHYTTITHPFLLSDNRHYSFYVWRRIINVTQMSKYALSIIYTISIIAMYEMFCECETSLSFILGFVFSTVLCIACSPLFEFRYYATPYILWRLLCISKSEAAHLEILWHIMIHLLTGLVFKYKEFTWNDAPNVMQHIMW